MKKTDNPYVNNMSLEEVNHAEDNHYYIQVDNETVYYKGKQTFTKDKAEYLFFELLHSMEHMIEEGDEQDRLIAERGLRNFRIHRLRIH